ncbi:MAG: hypothetical protein M3Z54_06410 [Gemmatimonadota bacterium]|nr:hypothetical protein [Gemmatimonadota bacterium]
MRTSRDALGGKSEENIYANPDGLALIGVDQTFLMFLVPGLMLLAAAWSPTI